MRMKQLDRGQPRIPAAARRLLRQSRNDRRRHRLPVLTLPALSVVDEIGYLPVNQDAAVLFFQLINARHERASTV